MGKALFEVSKKQINNSKETTKTTSRQNLKKAISYLNKSISLAEKQKMKLELAKSHYELGKILHITKKKKEAEKHLKEASNLYKEIGLKPLVKEIEKLKNEIACRKKKKEKLFSVSY